MTHWNEVLSVALLDHPTAVSPTVVSKWYKKPRLKTTVSPKDPPGSKFWRHSLNHLATWESSHMSPYVTNLQLLSKNAHKNVFGLFSLPKFTFSLDVTQNWTPNSLILVALWDINKAFTHLSSFTLLTSEALNSFLTRQIYLSIFSWTKETLGFFGWVFFTPPKEKNTAIEK